MSKIPKCLVGGMFEDEPSPRPRDDEVAIDLCLQALKLNPDSATALRKLRALETSVAKKKRPKINPEAKNARLFAKAHSLMAMNKYDAALEVCEEIFRTDPAHVAGHVLSFDAALEAGYRQRAMATLEYMTTLQSKEHTPQLSAALRKLASAYEDANKRDDALNVWKAVLKLDSSDAEALLKIRALSLQSGPPEERRSE